MNGLLLDLLVNGNESCRQSRNSRDPKATSANETHTLTRLRRQVKHPDIDFPFDLRLRPLLVSVRPEATILRSNERPSCI